MQYSGKRLITYISYQKKGHNWYLRDILSPLTILIL